MVYPQHDHELHQQHRGWHTYALTIQLWSVDAARAHETVGPFQEDNIQPARPDRNCVLCSRGTP